MQYIHVETKSDTSVILSCYNKSRGKQKKQKQRVNLLGTEQHEKIKACKRKNYENIIGTEEHEKIKAQKRERYCYLKTLQEEHEKVKAVTFDTHVKKFQKEIKKGPYFVCVVCNRCLYRKSVLVLLKINMKLSMECSISNMLTVMMGFDTFVALVILS